MIFFSGKGVVNFIPHFTLAEALLFTIKVGCLCRRKLRLQIGGRWAGVAIGADSVVLLGTLPSF